MHLKSAALLQISANGEAEDADEFLTQTFIANKKNNHNGFFAVNA
jgi:hypothetical protein